LYLFGTTLGLLVTSGLLRFGPAFENVAWSSLFILAPLGCVYYPLSILPEWLQIIAKGLPLVYLFEEARSILVNNVVNYNNIMTALALNLFYFAGAIVIFYLAFYGARKKGTLVNMGE
jgi:ABC-2 type transport system permease protein